MLVSAILCKETRVLVDYSHSTIAAQKAAHFCKSGVGAAAIGSVTNSLRRSTGVRRQSSKKSPIATQGVVLFLPQIRSKVSAIVCACHWRLGAIIWSLLWGSWKLINSRLNLICFASEF